jgi:hypothetical protein
MTGLSKREIILSLLALLTMVVIVVIRPDMMSHDVTQDTHPLFAAGLKEQLNYVDELVVTRGESTTTITKNADNMWVVKERSDYPASTAAIRKTLLFLSQSELRTKKTEDESKFVRLGLDDAAATNVMLKKAGSTLHTLVLGNITRDATSTYVRHATDTHAYVASGRLEVSATPNDWLDYDFFSLSRDRVKRIDFKFDGKPAYEYARLAKENAMVLSPLPEAKQLKQQQVPYDPSIYFERMAFTDVMAAGDHTASESKDITTVETFDGLVLRTTFYEVDLMPWVAFDASLLENINASLEEKEALQKEVQAINQRTKGWLYQLGQFQQDQLRRSYNDIVEDKPAPTPLIPAKK